MQLPVIKSKQTDLHTAAQLDHASAKFGKENRLLKRAEFKALLDGGDKSVSRLLVMLGAGAAPGAKPRLGLICSKKVGNAVTRNRIRRVLREHFRRIKQDLPALELVVIARHAARDASSEELNAAFDRCLRGVLNAIKKNA